MPKKKNQNKKIYIRSDTRLDFDCLSPGDDARKRGLLTVDYGFASGQIPCRSQGTLLLLSVRIQGIESMEQCAMQEFNLLRQRDSF
jgi:hypothetical protein